MSVTISRSMPRTPISARRRVNLVSYSLRSNGRGTIRNLLKRVQVYDRAGCPMTLERSKSPWMEIRTQVKPLVKGSDGDVVIIGAGITGLSAAYELACAGRKVVILDRAGVGAGMTGRTTAHLASALDDYYHRLVKLRGKDVAATHSRHHARAIDRIEHIQASESISCDFKRLPGVHVPARKKDE